MTQGRRLIEALKKRPHTYLEMNLLGISVSPHKRIAESLQYNERLIKAKRYIKPGVYLTTWAVQRKI